jgi:hypothetical protein
MALLQGLEKFKIDSGGSGIKNIQYIYVNFNNGTTLDINIDPVNIDKSIVRLSYNTNLSAKWGSVAPELINSTTVRLTRGTATTSNLYIVVIVEEYYNAKSKQTGSVTCAGTSLEQNITITAVDISKTIVVVNSYGNTASTMYGYYVAGGRLINSTTLGLKGYDSYLQTIVYQVLEIN